MLTTQRSLVVRRGPSFVIACCAGLGGALVVLVCLPALLRLGGPAAILLSALAVAEVGSVFVATARPGKIWLTGVAATAVVLLWLVTRISGAGRDAWAPVDATVGLTSRVCVVLQVVAIASSLLALRRRGPRQGWRRVAAAAVAGPLTAITVLAALLGMVGASNGFTGSPLPAAAVVAGLRSTVEYCRPDGVPLAMDVYMPRGEKPAPVVLYVHGGGLMLGNRTLLGPWASAHRDALFTPVLERLNDRGIAVASIDYRLLPGSDWRAPLEDVRCAVRFLHAHAADLGIDPGRIGAWGSSAGGTLVSLLALAPDPSGRPYPVQAVVDMFGPSDLSHLDDSTAFARTVARLALGDDQARRRALSPIGFVNDSAPPFLILHGRQDRDMPIRHSQDLAARLHQSGVQVAFVPVEGTGHTLATPGERPSAGELTVTVTDFLVRTLAAR